MSSKSPTQKGSEVLYLAHLINNKKRSISIHLMLRFSGMDQTGIEPVSKSQFNVLLLS